MVQVGYVSVFIRRLNSVFSTFETHLHRRFAILEVLRLAALQLNSSEYRFGHRRITILGHIVDAPGLQPDPEEVRAVQDLPMPRTPHSARIFSSGALRPFSTNRSPHS